MTSAELRDLIENMPECERHWKNVFVAPDGPEPTVPEQASAWRVKCARAGKLHPDAAQAIAQILGQGVTPRQVSQAKMEE